MKIGLPTHAFAVLALASGGCDAPQLTLSSPIHGSLFSTSDIPVRFQAGILTCRLDDATETACISPHVYRNVAQGFHKLHVSAGQTTTPASVGFVRDDGMKGIKQIAAGGTHACALFTAGNVRCWGGRSPDNNSSVGQLGYGNTNNIGDDELPSSGGDVSVGGAVTELALGFFHSCARLTTGAVRCWGQGDYGALGYGNKNDVGDDELPSSTGDVNVGGIATQITAGAFHTCALLATGKVRCWGQNGSGQLGYGHENFIGDDELPSSAGDVNVGGDVAQISAGQFHTCARLTSGAVRCWGDAVGGQLGYGNINPIGDDELPASAGDVSVGGSVVQISAGNQHTCALLSGGKVRCWGRNFRGQLGSGTPDDIGDNELPSSVGEIQVGAVVSQIDAGPSHTCALTFPGKLRCWGDDHSGELGYGQQASGYSFSRTFGHMIGQHESPSSGADAIAVENVLQVDTGGDGSRGYTCAVLASHGLQCWGQPILSNDPAFQ